MPIYEYRCQTCGRKVTIFWRSLSAVNDAAATCERCGSNRLVRLASRVRVVRGADSSSLDASADADDALLNEMAGLDENDPRAMARLMRRMAQESGEDLGPEFEEVVGRLEKGEDPEKIEQSMGDLFGSDAAGPDGMGTDEFGDPVASADSTEKAAEKAEEEKDKTATAKRRTVPLATKKPERRTRAKPRTTTRKAGKPHTSA